MELISREDVIRVIALERLPENSLNFCVKAYNDAIDRIQEVISQMDAIESRPKGTWVKESDYMVMGEGYLWNCSECGNRVYVDSRGVFPNYCDECGADMRTKAESEE